MIRMFFHQIALFITASLIVFGICYTITSCLKWVVAPAYKRINEIEFEEARQKYLQRCNNAQMRTDHDDPSDITWEMAGKSASRTNGRADCEW